jgi:AcrR family transcriptional regulator
LAVELSAPAGERLAVTPRHRVTADAVLDAACAVFAAEGFANANMDIIAARAGMTKPTLYARFGPKERLFAAVVRREHEMLSDWVVAEHESGGDQPFHQRLHRWIGVYFDFVRERPDGFKLTFEGERHAAAAQAVEEATTDRIDRITILIASLSGRPVGSGPRVVAAAIVGLLRWSAREAIRHPEISLDDVQAMCESMVSSAMHGLNLDLMDDISKKADTGDGLAG